VSRSLRSRAAFVDETRARDQFGQHHRDGLQRLDLDIVELALLAMLHSEYAHRPLAPHDRHTGEAVEQFFARFRFIGEVRMAGRLVQIESLDILGDGADQTFPERQLRDVDGFLLQSAGGEQFEHAVPQQVDRTDLGTKRLADDLDDLIELGLGGRPRRHHVVQTCEYLTRSGGCGHRCHAMRANRKIAGIPTMESLASIGRLTTLSGESRRGILSGPTVQRRCGLVEQGRDDLGQGLFLAHHAHRLAGHHRAMLDIAVDHGAAQRSGPIMLDLELGLAHLDLAVVEKLGNFALLGGEKLARRVLERADRNDRQARVDLDRRDRVAS